VQAQLNHIGIAANNLPGLKKVFSILGLQIAHTEPVPGQGVVTHFVPLPEPTLASGQRTSLEFLEVTDPEGTVAKFIEKRGPGIHHLSFQVETGQLDALCEKLKTAGIRLTYDQPRSGAHQMRINFIHPASAGGILIEVMEKAL
jgi:methylmalonyl-CoA/ethylmalonyl-CoA epimerase